MNRALHTYIITTDVRRQKLLTPVNIKFHKGFGQIDGCRVPVILEFTLILFYQELRALIVSPQTAIFLS